MEHTVVLASKGNDDARSSDDASTTATKSNKARHIFQVIPKHTAVFVVRVPMPAINGATAPIAHLEMRLQGNQMEGQLATRATRKWKQQRSMDFLATIWEMRCTSIPKHS